MPLNRQFGGLSAASFSKGRRRRLHPSPPRRRRGIATLGVLIAVVFSGIDLWPRVALADFDYNDNLTDFSSSPDTGYWQECEGSDGPCPIFSVNYSFSGGWGVEDWQHQAPQYAYTLDYESTESANETISGGVAFGGQCCPPTQIGVLAHQWVVECSHNRSTCGQAYTPYSSANDSGRQVSTSGSCNSNDSCQTMYVSAFEMDGFVDATIHTGACEWPLAANTVPAGNDCDSVWTTYDFGQ